MSYQVGNEQFVSFDEVVRWAWNEYKIDFPSDADSLDEDEKQLACRELECVLTKE